MPTCSVLFNFPHTSWYNQPVNISCHPFFASIDLSILNLSQQFFSLKIFVSIHLLTYLPIHSTPTIHYPPISLSIQLSAHPPTHFLIYPPTHSCLTLSTYWLHPPNHSHPHPFIVLPGASPEHVEPEKYIGRIRGALGDPPG